MSRASVLARGRAFAAQGFVDTCRIERRSGEFTVGTNVTPTYTSIYVGPCRIQAAAANWAGPTEVAEAALRLASFELQLPVVGTEGLRIDDLVTITTCAHDPDLLNRTFTVTGVSRKSEATTRKVPLLQVLS